jgi:hypothetical protein
MPDSPPKTVTATEVAAWVYCPESFRLNALGHKPANQPQRDAGVVYHRRMAKAERRTGCASVILLAIMLAAAGWAVL